MRVRLIEVVGQHRSVDAVPFLAGLLDDRDPEIWKAALDSLVMIGGPGVRDVLAAAEMSAPQGWRAWIAEAIQQVVPSNTQD